MGREPIELGIGTNMAHSEFAKPTAADIDEDSIRSALSLSFDPHLRIEIAKTSRVSFWGIGELLGRIVPYSRKVHTTEETTYYEDEPVVGDGRYEYDSETFEKIERETETKPVILPAGGLGLTVRLSENVLVSLGGYAQQAPVFFGQKTVHEFCRSSTGFSSDEECTGESPDDVDAFSRTLIGSGFGGVDLQFGDTLVRAQGFYHASPSNWDDHTPAGAQLSVRQSF